MENNQDVLLLQIVQNKNEWIGGVLYVESSGQTTEIIDIELRPNGETSKAFFIKGKEFLCGFDVNYGEIDPNEQPKNGIHFITNGIKFGIEKPLSKEDKASVTLKKRITGQVDLSHYQDGNLYYRCEDGFEFPVPVSQCGSARFLNKDKGILFMKWIKKHSDLAVKGINTDESL